MNVQNIERQLTREEWHIWNLAFEAYLRSSQPNSKNILDQFANLRGAGTSHADRILEEWRAKRATVLEPQSEPAPDECDRLSVDTTGAYLLLDDPAKRPKIKVKLEPLTRDNELAERAARRNKPKGAKP